MLRELAWEALMDPTYGSDRAPSGYDLLLLLLSKANNLVDEELTSREAFKIDCTNFLLI